jgi:hypothetical protein
VTVIGWEALPATLRAAVEARTGPIVKAEPVDAGHNHHLAAILYPTDHAPVFVKAVLADDRRACRQTVEAAVNTLVDGTAPRLLWHLTDTAGWDLLAFDTIVGARHANLGPDSSDLPAVTEILRTLGTTSCPPGVVTDRIEHRWRDYADPAALQLLAGPALLHTDLRPDNILIDSHRAWLVDWAWPTLGAAWIDPAIVALWMIAEGHTVDNATTWLSALPSGMAAPADGVDVFTSVNALLWSQIATETAPPWTRNLARAARAWAAHRAC